jgi:hypothetical protein
MVFDFTPKGWWWIAPAPKALSSRRNPVKLRKLVGSAPHMRRGNSRFPPEAMTPSSPNRLRKQQTAKLNETRTKASYSQPDLAAIALGERGCAGSGEKQHAQEKISD